MTLSEEMFVLRNRLQLEADRISKKLTGYGPTRASGEIRDGRADALVQMAEAIREIAGHLKL